MKKLVTIVLALVMILALGATAFADTATLTINDNADRTYAGYKLLNLTISLKGDAHHEAHEGDHYPECYNYAYTVNDTYREVLQAEVFANGGNYLWADGAKPTTAAGVTDDQIKSYLGNQDEKTVPQVADRLYRAILEAGIDADMANLTGDADVVEQGYWMFADVTDLSGNDAANSLVMVDTVGENNLEISPKVSLPTVEKKVKDIEDSEDDSILDNAWHDSADHDIGDTVPFKLTATLPSNAAHYKSYTLVFHDQMSAGLTLNAGSVKVYMYETKHKADVDTDLNDYVKDVTDSFVVTTENVEDGCTFLVGCDDVFTIEGVTKDTAFVVYYEATLNESAVIGGEGNPNSVSLEYSNNPYAEGTGEVDGNKVVVFTYQVIVNKIDSHGHALEGAGFTLSKKNIDGSYTVIGTELKGDAMTTFNWVGLDDGDYKLEETTVPEGFNKMNDMYFSVAATHGEVDGNIVLISLDGGLMGNGMVDTGAIEKDIVNNTGVILPSTGGKGTMLLIGGGALLVAVAVVFMITRKKMSVYED